MKEDFVNTRKEEWLKQTGENMKGNMAKACIIIE
jgi:hypothetical protein